MDTAKLKKFAQFARRQLMEQVGAKLRRVLAAESSERREFPKAIEELEKQIQRQGQALVIEQVAYTWFNRFCGLRFMDLNGYNRVRVVSPLEGQFQPEILAEAKMGLVDEAVVPEGTRRQVFALLGGSAVSPDPQGEAFRLLVVAVCNDWHRVMPYLFERIADYTELLMPEDLLSGSSVLALVREAMTPAACEDVEVLGWLYQFYISEKKDEVFAALKKNKKIAPENIPAATQLFTPNWIVRYLVENSLGRLWMLNRPQSRLGERMEYYIASEPGEEGSGAEAVAVVEGQVCLDLSGAGSGLEAGSAYLKISSPEEIKVCDPACGSGHLLTYAFDLLYAIYEEEGYEPSQIPSKILTHNLYGIEIDQRAGALAAFALTMKAREKQRRFFRQPVQPNICVLEAIRFEPDELGRYLDFVGRDLFTAPLLELLHQFKEADNFGSLIRPVVSEVEGLRRLLVERGVEGQVLLYQTHAKVLKVLEQADYLSPKYQVVVANPPYMGGKGMNPRLSAWVKDNYPISKSDLFAVFVERILDLVLQRGLIGFMTPFTWMFLSSYEKLRLRILNENTLTSLIRPEYHAFFDSAYVPLCAFTLSRYHNPAYRGAFIDLQQFYGADLQPVKALEAIADPDCRWFYRASAADFKKIPGSPIAYWVSQSVLNIFVKYPALQNVCPTKQGLATGNNDLFLRLWHEVCLENINFQSKNRTDAIKSMKKWFPCNKGGEFRKWFGNNEFIVNWYNDGLEIKSFYDERGKLRSRPQNQNFYFKEGLTWSTISSSSLSMRYSQEGMMFETKGAMCFPKTNEILFSALGFCNSILVNHFLEATSPTLDFHEGPVGRLPFKGEELSCFSYVKALIEIAQEDWDSYETSWGFSCLPLLVIGSDQEVGSDQRAVSSEAQKIPTPKPLSTNLKTTYTTLRNHWATMTQEMQRLEEENNRIFIEAHGLQDELTPEVPLSEITLTCNPHYRYSSNKTEAELEALLLADTLKEFISYAVGCMFGRYSLDKPGLILANQGETLADYLAQVPNPTFPPDPDNVIPLLDGDWFTDDISDRFRQFLKTTFGEDHYDQNLQFLEDAIGKDIRKYFLKDFYNDHLKRYKKRPIYWLFSSPKGSFNALIYLHRYRPDTVSIVLNDYLREFRTKLSARKDNLERLSISKAASTSEKTRALREIDKLSKILRELEEYEREILYPLAAQQIAIDLDDGVKVNYGKFGKALKKIPGLGDEM